MGLLYILPLSEDEREHVEVRRPTSGGAAIVLKSYGLPAIFWGYFAAICLIILIMFMAVHVPLKKLICSNDTFDLALGVVVYATLFLIPAVLSAYFFYEKALEKCGTRLLIRHRIFGIPVAQKKLVLKTDLPFEVMNFRASPNMARLQKRPEMRGFYNQGYFELFASLENGQKVFIDRHSRKADLLKMVELLLRY